MTDRELLEAAAKAARLTWLCWDDGRTGLKMHPGQECGSRWSPLTDDGDALRLAVALEIEIRCFNGKAHAGRQHEFWRTENWFPDDDRNAAVRRAIVRAAAALAAPADSQNGRTD